MEKRHTFAQDLSIILVKIGAIKEDEGKALQKAFKDADHDNFTEFLLDRGLIEEEDLLKALSLYYKVPAFDVVGYFFDHTLLQQFPKDLLLRLGIIPLEVEDDSIMIMVACEPNDPELLPAIGNYVSYDIQFRVGFFRDISDAIKEFYDRSPTDTDTDEDLREEREESREERRMELEEEELLWEEEEEE
jgi:hypothetical protein